MKTFTFEQLVKWSDGALIQGKLHTPFTHLVTDSRNLKPGDVFVALKGDRFDGHAFVSQAAKMGAVGALIQADVVPDQIAGFAELPADFGLVQVADTLRAFQSFAANYRKMLTVELVGVTGSSGKTSTKQLIAAVLQTRFKTAATVGNLNNHIGVPITLLTLTEKDQFGVIEMGMNHPGEIAPLVLMALPKIGVITNIGMAHIEHFPDQAGIAHEKSEIIAYLPKDGFAILDASDPWSQKAAERAPCPVIWVQSDTKTQLPAGINPTWRTLETEPVAHGVRFVFEKVASGEICAGTLPVFSRIMIKNALLAAAVGDVCGVTPPEIARGLETVELPGARMSIVKKPGEITLINDAYNANPDSMRAGLDALMDFKKSHRRLAVIGSMGELGNHAAQLHQEVGAYAGELPLAEIIFVGPSAKQLKAGAQSSGFSEQSMHEVENAQQALALLQQIAQSGDTILIKGSHFLGLEKIAEQWPSISKGDA